MNNWTNSNLLSTRTSNSASCKWNAPCFLSLSLRTCKQIKKPLLSMLNSASHDFNAPCFVSLSTPKQVKNLQESSPIGDNQCNACAMSWGLSSDICNYNHKYFCLLPRFYSLGDLKGHSRTLIMTLCRWFGYDFLLVAIKTYILTVSQMCTLRMRQTVTFNSPSFCITITSRFSTDKSLYSVCRLPAYFYRLLVCCEIFTADTSSISTR